MILEGFPCLAVCGLGCQDLFEPFVAGLTDVFHEMVHIIDRFEVTIRRRLLDWLWSDFVFWLIGMGSVAEEKRAAQRDDNRK